jgi:hypothetical protein
MRRVIPEFKTKLASEIGIRRFNRLALGMGID